MPSSSGFADQFLACRSNVLEGRFVGPVGAEVGQPGRELEGRVRERLGAMGGERRLEGFGVVAPATGVAHHHLEEHRFLGPGHDEPERGAQEKLDVGPDRARAVADGDLAPGDEDDQGRPTTTSWPSSSTLSA
jgi:hypothetical protein